MTFNLGAAARFMTAHARLLDRRRFAVLTGEGSPEAVVAATEAYHNPDGGYGWGLEPDLRAPESQPGGALHAFEAFADAAPLTTPRARQLCDWLAAVSLPDGGVPFALPLADPTACAPFWVDADPTVSSLQITAAVTAAAWRVAEHDPAVAAHPWLAAATAFCLEAAGRVDADTHAYELMFALQVLDAVHDLDPAAPALLQRIGALLPPSGTLPVAGGTEDEFLRPLDIAPLPGRPVRAHLDADVVAADLDRLAGSQGAHGGWEPVWDCYSPAARLEWSGYLTARHVRILLANGRAGGVSGA
jgi:hypothetical protein